MASAAWYRAVATLQHELRNPLQTMQAAVDVLRLCAHGAGPGTGPCEGTLEVLSCQIRGCGAYLDAQLRASRGPVCRRATRLSAVVAQAIARAASRASTRRLRITQGPPTDEPALDLDEGAVAHAFAQLFANAARARRDAKVAVAVVCQAPHLTCTVEDDGPGFPPAMLGGGWLHPQGQPLHRLGLMIVATTVESHGGGMSLERAASGGARVRLRFPLPARAEVAQAAPGAGTAGGPARVAVLASATLRRGDPCNLFSIFPSA